MQTIIATLTFQGRTVMVHTVPLGPVRLVFARTERGILACGAIDPAALQRFELPAARVTPGMTGEAALELF